MFFPHLPVHYTLELIPDCTHHCIGCGNVFQNHASSALLSASNWYQIGHIIASHAANIRISGGEPTLHPEFNTIIKTIAEYNLSFTLFTNARWKNPTRLIRFLKTVSQFKGLLVSLHGPSSELHESFTNAYGSFNETKTNIKQAIAAGIKVSTNTIITKANYDQINKILTFNAGLGVESSVFSRYVPVQNNSPLPTPDELRNAVSSVEAHRKNGIRAEFSVCIPQCFETSSSVGCLAGIISCVIDPWGNVRPCTHTSLVCGNLLDQPIEEIWHGPAMQTWREMIPFQCNKCLELPKCHGGCRASARLDKSGKDPLMGKPVLTKSPKQPEELDICKGAYPLRHFTIRQEPFGYLLVRGNRVIPVAHRAKPVLDLLDGNTVMSRIESDFGQEALNFVGTLYKKGFIEFIYPNVSSAASPKTPV